MQGKWRDGEISHLLSKKAKETSVLAIIKSMLRSKYLR